MFSMVYMPFNNEKNLEILQIIKNLYQIKINIVKLNPPYINIVKLSKICSFLGFIIIVYE